MSRPKISVIIPVYNGEKYLADTLDSVLSQSFKDFELIVIDDGSNDKTPEILKKYTEKDARLHPVITPNGGVSYARNIGLDVAKARYIFMSDADDLLHPKGLEAMYNAITSLGVDMVMFPYDTFDHVKKPHYSNKISDAQIVKDKDLFEYGVHRGLATSVYTKFFDSQKTWWTHVRFTRDMTYGEDMFFCWKYCLMANSAAIIDTPLYFYRQYSGQATTKYHDKLYETYKSSIDDIANFATQHGVMDSHLQEMLIKNFGKRLPALVRMAVRAPRSLFEKIKMVRTLIADERLQEYSKTTFDFYTKCIRYNLPFFLLAYGYKNEWRAKLAKTIKSR